ncbi:MAG: hypothetical protein VCD00_16565 [Candidatus Hydrogenedentota bacterium]
MNAASKKKLILAAALIVSVVALAWIGIHATQNPMDARYDTLQTEIKDIQVKPVFYVDPAVANFEEQTKAFMARPGLWRELIAPAKKAAPKPTGPNFKQLMEGIKPSRIGMTVGGKVKVRVATPQYPRGTWIQVGDMLNTAKVTQITDQFIVVEKSKGGKVYTHRLPRS